jgi:hypothetical protein
MNKRKKQTDSLNYQKKMIVNSTYLPIITQSVNGLNSPIKRCRMAETVSKQNKAQKPAASKKLTRLAKINTD